MAESVLSKLVQTDKETKKTLESIDSTLNKMYRAQIAQDKKENTDARKAAQLAKRRKADAGPLDSVLKDKKTQKEVKKSFMDRIGDFFKGIFSGGPGNFLKNLGIGAAITGGIYALFKSKQLRDGLVKAFGDAFKGIKDLVTSPTFQKGLKGLGSIVVAIGKFAIGGVLDMINGIGKISSGANWKEVASGVLGTVTGVAKLALILKPGGTLLLGFKALQLGVSGLAALLKGLPGMAGVMGAAKASAPAALPILAKAAPLAAAAAAPIAIAATAGAAHRQIRVNQGGGGVAGELYADNEERMAAIVGGTKNRRGRTVRQLTDAEKAELKELKELNKFIRESAAKRERETVGTGRGERSVVSAAGQAGHQQRVAERAGYQSGGHVTVPGSGTGDIVPAMLPPGSFVLNRNASSLFFQSGGMVPTMLEPGEKVFGPGSWGSGMAMLNSMVPRFQSGGIVPAEHPDTGSGYQPAGATDYKGRPVVLSKEAATQFARMMADSNGQVKGSDVHSSTRSPSKNQAVGGVPNSAHLSGNAIDIHGSSQAWIKANGAKYGFHIVDYAGSHGGHFKFTGGGQPLSQASNFINAPANMLSGFGSNIMDSLGGLGEWGQAISYFFREAGALFGLDQLASGLMAQFHGDDTSGPAAPINLSTNTKGTAKEMYNYIKGKGYTSAQAKGIVANIYRESGFRLDAVGDGGTSHGLFQWHAGRSSRMRSNVPNWKTNWKGQIDYALQDDVGPRYKGATNGMSAGDAAFWWQTKWERPADQRPGGPNDMKQRSFIKGLGFQRGGTVGMSGASSDARFKKAQSEFAAQIGAAAAPVVIPVPSGGGGAKASVAGGGTRKAPDLPSGPSSLQAAEYLYRLNMGMAF